MKQINLSVEPKYKVPLTYYEASDAKRIILILPAMGMSAGYYDKLGEAFAQSGISAVLFEQRGHGQSSIRASWRKNYGFKSWIETDLPASLAWINQNYPGTPVTVMGHSIGAHIGMCFLSLTHRQYNVDSFVVCAAGTPWKGVYDAKQKRQLIMLSTMMRVSCKTLGYFPGHRMGFAGREARDLVYDWLSLYEHNEYSAKGMNISFDSLIADLNLDVLSIRFEQDDFAPKTASEAILSKLQSARITRTLVTDKELGTVSDHFKWARRPRAVVDAVEKWMATLHQ